MKFQLEDYLKDISPRGLQSNEEKAGRATGMGIVIGLFRLSEAIESAASTLGNSIEYAAQSIVNELSDGR